MFLAPKIQPYFWSHIGGVRVGRHRRAEGGWEGPPSVLFLWEACPDIPTTNCLISEDEGKLRRRKVLLCVERTIDAKVW